jgi:chemotaxis protein methyltransferase CheR
MPSARLVELVTRKTGIELAQGGLREALDRYGAKRLRELSLTRIEDYITLVDAADGEELRRLIEIISVPHTWFFRDPEQLDIATEVIAARKGGKDLQIWVPACATGEDAYSLALLCASLNVPARIVGSDLSKEALTIAERGSYSPFSVRALPPAFRCQFRQRGQNLEVLDTIKQRVTFVEHNLLEPPLAAQGGWDLILCRNVFIYFSVPTAEACASRLGASLNPEGAALFGPGELIGASPAGLFPETIKNRVVYRPTNTYTAHVPLIRSPSPPLAPTPAPPIALQGIPQTLESHPDATTFEIAHQVLSSSSEAPTDPHMRMLSGIALYSAGDLERALHELRAASLLDEQLWPAAIYQGMCLESMGHPDLARAEYRHAVRVLQANPGSYSLLPHELRGLGPDLFEMARRKSAGSACFTSPQTTIQRSVTSASQQRR